MARTLQLDDAFKEEFERLIPDEAIREQILTGLRATVCLNPEVGHPIDDKPMSAWYIFMPDAPAWGLSAMTLIYSFDDALTYLNWIGPS